MAQTSSVLVGSYPSIPATSVTVTANAVQEVLAFSSTTRYLYHGTGSLSLLTAWTTLLDSHSELAGTAATVVRSGKTRTTSAVAFSIDSWGSDTTLRDLLGFTGTATSATTQTSNGASPLFWAPGRTESTTAYLGSDGNPIHDTFAGRSAPGIVVATRNNSWKDNSLRWGYVLIERFVQIPDIPGTYAYFWDTVLSRYRRFYVARTETVDSTDDSTALSFATRIPASLPYVMRHDGVMRLDLDRAVAYYERYANVEIPVETALEYT